MPAQGVWSASSSIISFERKPFSGGMPAIDRAAISVIANVTGIRRRSPPRRRMSRVCAS